MQITRTTSRLSLNSGRKEPIGQEPKPSEPQDSFVSRHGPTIVGVSGLAGTVGTAAFVATQFSGGPNGLLGALTGVAAGVATGAAAGLVAGEVFLRAYPLDEHNEKDKYTALARGAAGFTGALVGGVVGGVAGAFGAQPWLAAPAGVLGGAAAAGVADYLT